MKKFVVFLAVLIIGIGIGLAMAGGDEDSEPQVRTEVIVQEVTSVPTATIPVSTTTTTTTVAETPTLTPTETTSATVAAETTPVTTETVAAAPVISTPVTAETTPVTTETIAAAPVATITVTTPATASLPAQLQSCSIVPIGDFYHAWTQLPSELGCPQGNAVFTTSWTLQEFQAGRIFHLVIDNQAKKVFVINRSDKNQTSGGPWAVYDDLWTDGETFCDEAVQNPQFGPTRGIGKIWCESAKHIGPAIDLATGPLVNESIIQCFDKGCMIYDDVNDQIWALHSQGASWSMFQLNTK
jgi:hypothetical protein